jgi:recombinational DNA repair protein RecR
MRVTREDIDRALSGIREYIEGPEGQAVQKRLDEYLALARKEGRICPKCGRANKRKDWCPTCNRNARLNP